MVSVRESARGVRGPPRLPRLRRVKLLKAALAETVTGGTSPCGRGCAAVRGGSSARLGPVGGPTFGGWDQRVAEPRPVGGAYIRLQIELWDGTTLCGRGLSCLPTELWDRTWLWGRDFVLWAGLRGAPGRKLRGASALRAVLRRVGGNLPVGGTTITGRGLSPFTDQDPGLDRALWAGLTPVYPPSSGTGPRSVGGASPGGGTAARGRPYDRPSHPGTSGCRVCIWRWLEPERQHEGVGGLVRGW